MPLEILEVCIDFWVHLSLEWELDRESKKREILERIKDKKKVERKILKERIREEQGKRELDIERQRERKR